MIGSRGTRSVSRAGGRYLKGLLFGRAREVRVAPEGLGEVSVRSFVTGKKLEGASSKGTSDYLFSRSITAATMPETKQLYPALEKLGLLSADHIRIKNKDRTEELISAIMDGGFSKLQFVVDFDFTLTRVHDGGKRCHCSWGIMDNSSLMPAFYREEANKLLAKYYPIEIDHKLSEEEKIPHMLEWYGQIHQLIVRCQVSRQSMGKMIHASTAKLRVGTEEMCQKLQKTSVPMLVFSAGMGDILVEVLKHYNVYTENVKVVSNFFKYSEEDVVTGFVGNLIHMFNKNENAIHHSDYFNKLEGRTNVVLMGDSLGDTKMATGVPQPSNILKIGFLNDKIDERLETYLNNFDIVLTDDQTMDVANSIIDMMA